MRKREKSKRPTFRLKLEDDKTVESGNEFQIFIIQFVKKFFSLSAANVHLANLSEIPRVKL
jgi:hypothetical protein